MAYSFYENMTNEQRAICDNLRTMVRDELVVCSAGATRAILAIPDLPYQSEEGKPVLVGCCNMMEDFCGYWKLRFSILLDACRLMPRKERDEHMENLNEAIRRAWIERKKAYSKKRSKLP